MHFHKICFFVPLYQIFVFSVTVFEKKGILVSSSESIFQFFVRYGCIMRGKIERLYACYMVESLRFKHGLIFRLIS